MAHQDSSGKDVGFVILLAIVGIVGFVSFLDSYDDKKARLTEKDEKIAELQQKLIECRAEFQGYVNGRR